MQSQPLTFENALRTNVIFLFNSYVVFREQLHFVGMSCDSVT
jgi:hypothetical protein